MSDVVLLDVAEKTVVQDIDELYEQITALRDKVMRLWEEKEKSPVVHVCMREEPISRIEGISTGKMRRE